VVGRSRTTGQTVVIDRSTTFSTAQRHIGIFGHSGAGKDVPALHPRHERRRARTQLFVMTRARYGRLARAWAAATSSSRSALARHQRARPSGASRARPRWSAAATPSTCAASSAASSTRPNARRWIGGAGHVRGGRIARLGTSRPLPADSRVARVLARWVQGSLGQLFSRPPRRPGRAHGRVACASCGRDGGARPLLLARHSGRGSRIGTGGGCSDRRLGLLFEDRPSGGSWYRWPGASASTTAAWSSPPQNPGDLLSGTPARWSRPTRAALLRPPCAGEAAKLQRAFDLSEVQRTAWRPPAGASSSWRPAPPSADHGAGPARGRPPPWRVPELRPFVESLSWARPSASPAHGRSPRPGMADVAACTGPAAGCRLRDGAVVRVRTLERHAGAPLAGIAPCAGQWTSRSTRPRAGCVRVQASVVATADVDVAESGLGRGGGRGHPTCLGAVQRLPVVGSLRHLPQPGARASRGGRSPGGRRGAASPPPRPSPFRLHQVHRFGRVLGTAGDEADMLEIWPTLFRVWPEPVGSDPVLLAAGLTSGVPRLLTPRSPRVDCRAPVGC